MQIEDQLSIISPPLANANTKEGKHSKRNFKLPDELSTIQEKQDIRDSIVDAIEQQLNEI